MGYEYFSFAAFMQSKKQFKKAIFYLNKSKTFLKDFPTDNVQIGSRLAECYLGLNKLEEAENIAIKNLEYKNLKIGFAGGGVPTPINARGEISDESFSLKLNKLGHVDIICTHAPPFVRELITDVITNKEEQGWSSLKDYILEKEPRFSIFGDVHQPQASRWRLGRTECMNVGYFRANSNYLELTSLLQ